MQTIDRKFVHPGQWEETYTTLDYDPDTGKWHVWSIDGTSHWGRDFDNEQEAREFYDDLG